MSLDLSGFLKLKYDFFPSTRPKPNTLAHLNKPHNLRYHSYNTNDVWIWLAEADQLKNVTFKYFCHPNNKQSDA